MEPGTGPSDKAGRGTAGAHDRELASRAVDTRRRTDLLTAALIAVTVIALWRDDLRGALGAFLVVSIIILIGRSFLAMRDVGTGGMAQQQAGAGFSAQLIGLSALLLGMNVGFAVFRFLELDDAARALLVGFAFGGICLVMMIGHAGSRLAQLAFLLPVAAGVYAHLLAAPSQTSLLVGLVATLFFAALGLLGAILYRLGRGNAELRRLNTDLARQLRIAESASGLAEQAKTDFLANMSHELRTPLNAIMGFSDTLRMQALGPIGNPKYLEYAQHIHASGGHLLTIVSDVLDAAKLDSGMFDLQEEWFELGAMIDEAVATVAPPSERRALTITRKHAGLGKELFADRRIVLQITINLLSNAVKYTPSGGDVRLRGEMREVDGAARWALVIEDTGIGIPETDIEAMFEPFRRSRTAIDSQVPGTGLGLHLVRTWARAHGATVGIESRIGVGTTVRVEFDARRVREQAQGSFTFGPEQMLPPDSSQTDGAPTDFDDAAPMPPRRAASA